MSSSFTKSDRQSKQRVEHQGVKRRLTIIGWKPSQRDKRSTKGKSGSSGNSSDQSPQNRSARLGRETVRNETGLKGVVFGSRERCGRIVRHGQQDTQNTGNRITRQTGQKDSRCGLKSGHGWNRKQNAGKPVDSKRNPAMRPEAGLSPWY